MDLKNKVDPNYLEKWLTDNPDIVYKRSVETANNLVSNPDISEDLFLEFYWDDKIYSKILMKRIDVITAMDKAIEYFVLNEMYEFAQEAKRIQNGFNNLNLDLKRA